MKFFHYSAGTVERCKGRSCVQAVAYATRSDLYEERRGILANYTHVKEHDVSWETLSPENSGIDNKDLSIWNKADLDEDKILSQRHKDPEILQRKLAAARPAYADEFSLPKELNREQNIELAREYVRKMFISKGLVATYAIHWEEGNPHVHIIYSARSFDRGEFSVSKTVSRDLRGPGGVRSLREVAAYTINKHQELAGLEDRVDQRSYAARGINLIATQHKGWEAHQREREGRSSRIVQDNHEISRANKEQILREPGIIIKELGSTQATFSEMDIVRLMQNRLKDDIGILGEHVLRGVMENVVEVGIGIDNLKRYTTQEYADKEARILKSFDRYLTGKSNIQIDLEQIDQVIQSLQEKEKETGVIPKRSQINGIKTLCGASQFYVMIGRAGTGKTTTLKPVVSLHEGAGYRVIGMAPSAAAASQLEADTGCPSDTIAHYAHFWKKYDEALEILANSKTDKQIKAAQKLVDKYIPYLPDSKTLIIIDEAGMVGVGDLRGAIPGGWDAITKAIDRSGAKLVLTGDDHQFKPIEAGDVFRRLVYNLRGGEHLCNLTDIVRQKTLWMREASHHLAEQNVSTALGMYETQGHIQGYASHTEVYEEIARQYLRNIVREPDSRGIVIAATNEERLALNREIRAVLKENGFLSQEDALQWGEDGYCVGDQIVFTKNDRGWNTEFECPDEGFFVQNSMQAVIQSITPVQHKDSQTGEITETHEIVAFVPKHNATVKFNLQDYKSFSHAYAVTGYKSQGDTLDWVLLKLSRFMDAHGLYVCLTRHRQDVSLYYSQEDFANYQALVSSLSKVSVKDLVVDYSISDENQEYWQNVQDYKETGRELLGVRTLANSLRGTASGIQENKENREELESVWKNYRTIEKDRKSWANFILRDWEVHKDFVRQAGLTRESLEIASGAKKRSLSRIEHEAQAVVEQYVSLALETRQLWRDIRRTHPGSRAKTHPDWQKFEDARKERGVLANQICLRPILYQPFLKETAENLVKADAGYGTKGNKISYSMATIKAQAEAHQSKMLQQELLKGNATPDQQDMLKVLIAYVEARDHFGQMWQEIRPKLAALKGSLEKEIAECMEMRMARDAHALSIVEKSQEFEVLASKVGIKLKLERLVEEAARGKLDTLIQAYKSSPQLTRKLKAASEMNALIKGESELEKKPIIARMFQQGLQPKDIARDALEYSKINLFESLKTEETRELFVRLDEYGDKCRQANQIYAQCIEDTKEKDQRPWESPHYPSYKDACLARNDLALGIFDQRDYNQVLSMAEAMGIQFKDVELSEIFSRGTQAERSRRIAAYLKDETPESKGQAAIALRQMICLEKRQKEDVSPTARQVFYAGIDFKDMQTTAFEYERSRILKGLGSEKEIRVYRALGSYENAYGLTNRAYQECLEVAQEKTKPDKRVKPWRTDKFKEYISLVTLQDEQAYRLINEYDANTVIKIAQQMGISVKKLDVEAHRHSLRQTLQTFIDGDRTNVPMAASEVLNWLEFDRHSDHKHTFKVLREQDLWPKDIQESLQDYFAKKRQWRREEKRGVKDAARAITQDYNPHPQYKIITYERRQTYEEVNQQLTERIYKLATDILGKPTSQKRDHLRFGKNCSVSVFISGKRQGIYTNFETTGKGGGPLKMIQEQMGLSSRDALEWATDWLGGNPFVIERRAVQDQRQEAESWKPITPVPNHVKGPEDKLFNYLLKDGYREAARYAYRDEQERLLGYVVRFEKPNPEDSHGKNLKTTRPLAYCENEKGDRKWKAQGFFGEEKLPYGLEKLARDPAKPVLIVEGEKSVDAAQKLLPDYHVLGWIGGAGSINKTNWGCLVGREAVIWPDHDHDQGGQKAAQKLEKLVTNLNKEAGKNGRIGVVNLPEYLPDKWDLADQLPKGWMLDTVKEMIKDATPSKDKGVAVLQKPNQESALTTREEFTQTRDRHDVFQKSVHQFIALSETHDKLTWGDPQFKVIDTEIKKIVSQYLNDEKFIQQVENSKSPAAIERLNFEITKKRQASRNQVEYELDEYGPRDKKIAVPQHPKPESVINQRQEFTQDRDAQDLFQKSVYQFIVLSETHDKLAWNNPQFKGIDTEIKKIANQYLDDERFIQEVENSKNHAAIERLNFEITKKRQASRSQAEYELDEYEWER